MRPYVEYDVSYSLRRLGHFLIFPDVCYFEVGVIPDVRVASVASSTAGVALLSSTVVVFACESVASGVLLGIGLRCALALRTRPARVCTKYDPSSNLCSTRPRLQCFPPVLNSFITMLVPVPKRRDGNLCRL